MTTASTPTKSPQTKLRTLRRLLEETMTQAGQTPPICFRIRELRERLKDQQGGEYSQEKVAQRVGVSLKAYRAYEDFREPNADKRRRIALALGQPEDYFEPHEVTEQVREVVREELSDVLETLRRLEARQRDEEPPQPD
jgi:transcriptional regulator with XRE-family HTH domain